jgi:DNA-binding PadR family transcriptional regulator
MKYLSRADEILLLAIVRLQDNAYGVTIIKEVETRANKKLTLGGLWVSLDNLYRRGYVIKTIADPTPERGGRGKIYYKVTPEGMTALENVRQLNAILWEGLVLHGA